jgi:glycosyltransferase involved in cell wall biosynthesis
MPLNNSKIPVTVIIVTKNEASRIKRCIDALQDFDEIIVVDSVSDDDTQKIAAACGARVVNFSWNGQYPKKRQWCLDTLKLPHEFVFFVDADEIVTPELIEEIRTLDFSAPGYFVKGRYVFEGRSLSYGLQNNKLALLDRRKMAFPVIDDLDLPGMGEIEGHYQPVLRLGQGGRLKQLKSPLLHYAYENRLAWEERHLRYAAWEKGMNVRKSWPEDVRLLKRLFKAMPVQAPVVFFYSYIIKLGFLDGLAGLRFAFSRFRYYRSITNI